MTMNVANSQLRITSLAGDIKLSLDAEKNKIYTSVNELATHIVSHLAVYEMRDYSVKAAALDVLENDKSAEVARKILEEHGVSFEEVKPSDVKNTLQTSQGQINKTVQLNKVKDEQPLIKNQGVPVSLEGVKSADVVKQAPLTLQEQIGKTVQVTEYKGQRAELANLKAHQSTPEFVEALKTQVPKFELLKFDEPFHNLVHFKCLANVNDEVIQAIAKNFPNTKTLTLGSCEHLTRQGLKAIASLKNLEQLEVTNLKITDVQAFNGFKEMSKMEVFSAKDCDLPANTLNFLSKSIRKIELSSTRGITDFSPLLGMPLTHANLRGMEIKDDDFYMMIDHFKDGVNGDHAAGLQKIDVEGSTGMDMQKAISIFSKLTASNDIISLNVAFAELQIYSRNPS